MKEKKSVTLKPYDCNAPNQSFVVPAHTGSGNFDLCWGLTTRQPLWVILCRLPEKGRKVTEEIAEEMKERDREERETGMKVKKQKKQEYR